MLTGIQFTAELNRVSSFIYLGGPSRFRTQSSMLPVLNALNTYNGAPIGANLLNLITVIDAVPGLKKIKYTAALNALYADFPNPIYVTVNPFAISLLMANGIGIPRSNNVRSHQVDAVLALRTLHGFPAGNALLTAICQRVAINKRCAIVDASHTASGGNECAALGMSDDATNQLIVALAQNHGAVGACISAALTAMGHAPAVGGSYAWLQGQIDAMPIPNIRGMPSVTPSSNIHGANWISAAMLQAWVTNTAQFPAPLVGQPATDAVLVLGAVLYPGAVPNAGTHTRVNWNAANQSAVSPRPPFIGLAHELVHAMHNQRGDQAGYDTNTTTGVLYEYLCVGLGPFANALISENSIRAGAGVAQRDRYAN
ncbi:MAG: hypothetical protein HQK65_18135 [Desulfamplus sp.]|nr:hypothetical protein [Desulfamplus sp.]